MTNRVPPHLVEKFVLRDHAVAVAHEVGEHIEDLRLDGHPLPSPAEFHGAQIKLEITEGIDRATVHRTT